MKAFVFSIIAIVAAGPAMAEVEYGSATQRAGVYFCTSKQGGGAAYNKDLDRWVGQGFSTEESFIFRLSLIGEKEVESFPRFMKDTYGEYDVEMTYTGTKLKEPCLLPEGGRTIIGDDGGFACKTLFADYRVNLTNLRFLYTSTSSYFFQKENEESSATVQVMIGKCTKIN